MAEALYKLANYSHALISAKKAVKLSPSSHLAYLITARIYYKMKHFRRALYYCHFGLKLQKYDLDLNILKFKISLCYCRRDDTFQTLKLLKTLLIHHHERWYFYQGLSQLRTGFFQNAWKSFRRSLPYTPLRSKAFYCLALLSSLRRQPRNNYLRKTLALSPHFKKAQSLSFWQKHFACWPRVVLLFYFFNTFKALLFSITIVLIFLSSWFSLLTGVFMTIIFTIFWFVLWRHSLYWTDII